MKRLVIAVVCSAMLSVLAVLACTALSQDARPTASGDAFLSIPACAFTEHNDDYDFVRSSSISFSTGSGVFRAPVNLPNGSVIKKVILICWDGHSTYDIDLSLYRVPQSGSAEKIATVSSSGGVGGSYRMFSQILTSDKYVNTWKHSHYLCVNLPGTAANALYFSQAKIVYTPPS